MRKVLVVDDYQTNGLLVKQALPEDIYYVKVVVSGQQALSYLKTSKADVVLLDIVMPDMDGIETLKHIKEDPALRNIPVIFLTGQADKQKVIEGFELGIVDVIAKPISPVVVRERIERALRSASRGGI